ncbi:MAG: 4-hydroxythreonine-4-phosphate dehydrogenase PdxA [Prevotellaceae bacterium]|jgi:4-hydroxythreonine-4-phosphate dehydrogenase|nr:4-hydroxythreonine-4-phosphate dehydrogenase PdxA [Prevotellaceae bacterium]
MSEKLRVGITQGDSNGVGYEVIIKTLADVRLLDFCIPVVYGATKVLSYYRKLLNADPINYNSISIAGEFNPKQVNVVNCISDDLRVEPGKSTLEAAQEALRALQTAVGDLKRGKIDVLVTAPFNKQTIHGTGFSFPGHTEYLAQTFNGKDCIMLFISDVLRVGVITGHIPLADVSKNLSKECIIRKLEILNASLQRDFGVHKPRIAVLGLNPHASDGGLLGKEEDDIIIPAIMEAEKQGILAFGPYASDGFFGAAAFKRFDAVMAMYHDQGLVPFKAISFNTGVNYTAGLPIVRTSPAHGVGYDIVKDCTASPDSLRAAIYAACDIWRHRKEYDRTTANPLPPVDFDALPSID